MRKGEYISISTTVGMGTVLDFGAPGHTATLTCGIPSLNYSADVSQSLISAREYSGSYVGGGIRILSGDQVER